MYKRVVESVKIGKGHRISSLRLARESRNGVPHLFRMFTVEDEGRVGLIKKIDFIFNESSEVLQSRFIFGLVGSLFMTTKTFKIDRGKLTRVG